ncbi:MAG: precorrin-4 C(11)-methyltransferase [Firmicutes bacterium]|nr:precorrin-4 C(11)-methyltransferase [Bacillota bacterium]
MTGKVYFIGAGPGDPELITLKGKRLIERADVIIYAGSLVNPEVIGCRREGAEVYNSAQMTLDQVIGVMERSTAAGKSVARVHTGDPSIFGAIREQFDRLRQSGIEFEVVPGVSSFLGAAAELRQEYTLPGVSQTVILTRREGRTPVPPGEKLSELARHRASLVIFLSAGMMDQVVEELREGYPRETPVAVFQKATWPDQLVIRGVLGDIAEKVREAEVDKTALILVGDFLGDDYELSRLYSENFSHGFREAVRD